MCLASPRVDLQSNSRGARHEDPVDLARAFAHGHLNGANPRNEASKVGPRIETRLVTSVDTEKAMAMEVMERVETETKAVRAVSAVSVVSEDVASRLHHSEPVVRQAAAAALGALGEVAAEHVRQLASLIEDVDSGVRRAAAIALGNLGQRAVGHADAASAQLISILCDFIKLRFEPGFNNCCAFFNVEPLGPTSGRPSFPLAPGFPSDFVFQIVAPGPGGPTDPNCAGTTGCIPTG